jgi:hypothetical protein
MWKRPILALLAMPVLAPLLSAQMRGGLGRPAHGGPSFGRGMAVNARPQPNASRGFFLGDTAYYYADYPFGQFAAESAAPTVVARRPLVETPQEKAEPLLIELRGDRYVRFGGVQKSAQRGVSLPPDYAAMPFPKPESRASVSKTNAVPPATLIYRDGHHEEVSDYAIVGSVMYARGDFWKNGYWTKNIQLSALNIPATMKLNQDNGVKFALPAGPNEVVTRP